MIRFAPVPGAGKHLFIIALDLRFRLRNPGRFSTLNAT